MMTEKPQPHCSKLARSACVNRGFIVGTGLIIALFSVLPGIYWGNKGRIRPFLAPFCGPFLALPHYWLEGTLRFWIVTSLVACYIATMGWFAWTSNRALMTILFVASTIPAVFLGVLWTFIQVME